MLTIRGSVHDCLSVIPATEFFYFPRYASIASPTDAVIEAGLFTSTALRTDSFNDKDRHTAGLNLDEQYSLLGSYGSIL